jgi:hypothetical protein
MNKINDNTEINMDNMVTETRVTDSQSKDLKIIFE